MTCSESLVARVQKPAPEFSANAVVAGEIKKVSLSDFKGEFFRSASSTATLSCDDAIDRILSIYYVE